jgi:hypothetical protein
MLKYFATFMKLGGFMTTSLFYPKPYVDIQIRPAIKDNDRSAEVVWTYLVARKYENNYQALVSKLLCGTTPESLPRDNKIWIEAYLQPTRQDERDSWKTRADLAIGHLEVIKGSENQIQSSGGEWVCIVESKWYDDIQTNAINNESNQLLKIIDHALLIHDNKGNFPKSVYVTLVTPKYFKEGLGKFSHREYSTKYEKYNEPERLQLKKELNLCTLPFVKHNLETLISRTSALILNWVTFEELLGLPNLVDDHIPGKYKVTIDSWKEIFSKMDMEDSYIKLSSKTGGR